MKDLCRICRRHRFALLGLAGLGLVVAGAASIYWPAGLITAGALILFDLWEMRRASRPPDNDT